MRRIASVLTVLLGTVLTVAPACAGPKVGKAVMQDLPDAALSEGESIRANVDVLEAAIDEAETEADEAQGQVRTLKLEIKATRSEWKAAKAKRKAAKKANDSERMQVQEERMEALDAEQDQLEAELDRYQAYIDLLDERVDLLEAEQDLRKAQEQLVYARAAQDTHPDVDQNRFEAKVQQKKIAFQDERADAADAERKYIAKGGDIDVAERISAEGASGKSGEQPVEGKKKKGGE